MAILSKKKSQIILHLLPMAVLCLYFLYGSFSHNLHDFSNSYFAARLVTQGIPPETVIFDIYEFNNFIWNLGYKDVLVDFYLNSPFTITVFYPLSFIEDAYTAKAIFNLISIVLFIWSVCLLIKKKVNKRYWILLILPIIFLVPIRNQILFGQSYFLVLSLIIFGFLFIDEKKESVGASLLSFAVLLKIFPVFYGISLLFHKNWKSIIAGFFMAIVLMSVSIYITGFQIWKTYFLEILPNAIQNNSTVDFRFNAQSIDVFLKTLFIQDYYYNPNALFNSERLYFIIKWIVKSIIIGFALRISFVHKNNLFKLLSIWIVTLFLLQSRTVTYTQILWMIPLFYILNEKIETTKKILFLVIVFVVCNIPVYKLESLPIILKFSKLWFTILLAILFYSSFSVKINLKWIIAVFIVLFPLHLEVFKNLKKINSDYVLATKEYFMIYDFFEKDGSLFIKTLGKNGNEIVNTNISITSFDENICEFYNNQILLNKQILTDDFSLKKKPVLINNNEVYYLTDHRSRRGAFTLKKINIEKFH